MVLVGTLSTDGCVGFLPLFVTMSGLVACWAVGDSMVAGWGPLLDLQSSSLSWAKAPSLSLSSSLSSLSGIRGGGPSLSPSSSGLLSLMRGGYGAGR